MALTVGIAGITGKFARCVLANLLKQPSITVRGYCRDPTKLPPSIQSSPRVHLTKGESNDVQALQSFVRGTDVVICCYLGDNQLMTDGQKKLIDACELEGVKRYIASDYTLDFTKLEYGQLPSKDPMKTVKDYLSTKTVEGVHVLIGAFMDTFWSQWFGVWDPVKVSFSYWGTGEEAWESTSYENAAEFVSAVALDDGAIGMQKFLGDRKNIFQLAELFERVYGVKPKLERLGSLDELYKRMHQLKEQDPQNIFSYLNLFYQYYCTNGQTSLGIDPEKQEHLGVKRVTFEDYLRSHSIESLATAVQSVGSTL